MPQPPRARQPLAPLLAPLAPRAAVRSPGAPAASFSAVGAFAAAVSILGAAGWVLRRPAQTTESGLETELMPAVFTVTPEDLPSPQTRKVSALKAELDERGVQWRGVCFEKEDLVTALVDAPAPSPPRCG